MEKRSHPLRVQGCVGCQPIQTEGKSSSMSQPSGHLFIAICFYQSQKSQESYLTTTLAEGACVVCLDIFFSVYHLSFLSHALWETARYRLKYCLKGPLCLKQPTYLLNLLNKHLNIQGFYQEISLVSGRTEEQLT